MKRKRNLSIAVPAIPDIKIQKVYNNKNLISNEFQINPSNLKKIGEGIQSKSYQYKNEVFKVIPEKSLDIFKTLNKNRYLSSICPTIMAMSNLNWPNLTKIHDCNVKKIDEHTFVFLREHFITNGINLSSHIKELNEEQILEIIFQIILTIKVLSDNKLFHNDLNFSNILLIDNHKERTAVYEGIEGIQNFVPKYIVKIIDYGLSTSENPLNRVFSYHPSLNIPSCDICYIFALFHRYGLETQGEKRREYMREILNEIFEESCGEFFNIGPELKSSREIVGLVLKNKKNCNNLRADKNSFNEMMDNIIKNIVKYLYPNTESDRS